MQNFLLFCPFIYYHKAIKWWQKSVRNLRRQRLERKTMSWQQFLKIPGCQSSLNSKYRFVVPFLSSIRKKNSMTTITNNNCRFYLYRHYHHGVIRRVSRFFQRTLSWALSTMVNSSLTYEILMYLNSFYFGMFATCEIGEKSENDKLLDV